MSALSRFLGVCLVVVGAVGCGGSSAKPDVAVHTQSLWSFRSPYVGDNSRVAALVSEVGVARAGSYIISLQTAKSPYRLTIALKGTEKPFAATNFSDQATLLLGLIGNLDEVSISSGPSRYVLTTGAASKKLGYDVKRLGQDKVTLSQYLDKRND